MTKTMLDINKYFSFLLNKINYFSNPREETRFILRSALFPFSLLVIILWYDLLYIYIINPSYKWWCKKSPFPSRSPSFYLFYFLSSSRYIYMRRQITKRLYTCIPIGYFSAGHVSVTMYCVFVWKSYHKLILYNPIAIKHTLF